MRSPTGRIARAVLGSSPLFIVHRRPSSDLRPENFRMNPTALGTRLFLRSLTAALVGVAALTVASPVAHAQSCTPAACAATHHYVGFESLAAGASVEGPGAVDPVLIITSQPWGAGTPSCTVGSAAVIEEGNPFPFVAYGTPAAIDNGCLTGIHGFADDANCVLDYEFTFATGHIASCFGLRILDYGDYFPYGGTNHIVQLAAFDAANVLVDQDVFTVVGPVDAAGGDACSSGENAVGNHLLAVAGPGIVRVTLRFNAFPDPNVGFDDLTFCEAESATPALPASWGRVKAAYHR
jgi:hypothetical protein